MFDCHIHYSADVGAERLLDVASAAGYDGFALLCIAKGGMRDVLADALWLRGQTRLAVLVFGGVPVDTYALPPKAQEAALLSICRQLRDRGCTGLKLLEGKPSVYKALGVPAFDAPVWEAAWSYLERTAFPVVMHLNDPRAFWDVAGCSDYARSMGWCYDAAYPAFDAQLAAMERVLMRHPALHILFPHFLFLSAELARLAALLDRYPHVMIDTTPGLEQYPELAAQPEAARAFFHRYADRICFGTDIGSRSVVRTEPWPLDKLEAHSRIRLVQHYLTERTPWTLAPDNAYVKGIAPVTVQPLGLSQDALTGINGGNFLRFAGVCPVRIEG